MSEVKGGWTVPYGDGRFLHAVTEGELRYEYDDHPFLKGRITYGPGGVVYDDTGTVVARPSRVVREVE